MTYEIDHGGGGMDNEGEGSEPVFTDAQGAFEFASVPKSGVWVIASGDAIFSEGVATEDVAYLFASMGKPTGVDFDALMALRGRIAGWLEGEALHGNIWRAGLPKTLRQAARA